MKNIIILFLIISVNYIHAQELKINWETKPKNGEIDYSSQIDSTHFFLNRVIEKGGVLRKLEFNELELNLENLSTKTTILPFSLNHPSRFLTQNNKSYWFGMDESGVFLKELDANFKETSQKLILGTPGIETKFVNDVSYFFQNNLVFFTAIVGRDLSNIYIRVTDTESKTILYEKTIPFPSEFKHLDIICTGYLEDGTIIFLMRPSIDKSTGLDNLPIKGESNKLIFITVTKTETTQTITELPENLFIYSGEFFDNNGDKFLQLVGKEKGDDESLVFASLKWDANEKKADLIAKTIFTEEESGFLKSVITNEYFIKFIPLADGTFLTLVQKYKYQNQGFINEDITVYHVLKNGEIEWKKGIQHRGASISTDYVAFINSENNLILLMRDADKCYDSDGKFIPDVLTKPYAFNNHYITGVINVDLETHEIERKLLKGLNDELIDLARFYKISENKYLIYKCNEETESFGILTP